MTLTEMRRALRETSTTADAAGGGADDKSSSDPSDEHHPTRPKSRLPPAHRGVKQSRSCLVEMNLAGAASTRKQGTLTFANTVGTLKRAGSSREGPAGAGGLRKPPRRSAPQRAQSSMARVRGSGEMHVGPIRGGIGSTNESSAAGKVDEEEEEGGSRSNSSPPSVPETIAEPEPVAT